MVDSVPFTSRFGVLTGIANDPSTDRVSEPLFRVERTRPVSSAVGVPGYRLHRRTDPVTEGIVGPTHTGGGDVWGREGDRIGFRRMDRCLRPDPNSVRREWSQTRSSTGSVYWVWVSLRPTGWVKGLCNPPREGPPSRVRLRSASR